MSRASHDPKRRAAIARIIAGQTTAATEAQVLGMSKRQVERLVEASRKLADVAATSQNPATSVVSQSVTPSGATSTTSQNPALDAARRGAGVAGATSQGGGITPAETHQAGVDMAQFCVDAINQAKAGAVSALVWWRYSPPLELTDPAVGATMELCSMADASVRMNAAKIYPFLSKLMNGPYQLAGALVMDIIFTAIALDTLAKSKGWAAPEKQPSADEERRESYRRVAAAQQPPRPAPAGEPPSVPQAAPRTKDYPGKEATQAALRDPGHEPTPGTYMGAPIEKPAWAA